MEKNHTEYRIIIFSFLSKVEKYTCLNQWIRKKQMNGGLMAIIGITTLE